LAADEIWHAGDIGEPDVCAELKKIKPVKAVYGNIDPASSHNNYPENLIFDCEKVKILMTHIAGSFSKYNPRVKQLIRENKPTVLICGHSHILKVAYDKTHDVLYMNPGACGVHGFHKIKTMLRFSVDGDKLTDLAVIELGSRTKEKN
jgi:putative phosphoesterase